VLRYDAAHFDFAGDVEHALGLGTRGASCTGYTDIDFDAGSAGSLGCEVTEGEKGGTRGAKSVQSAEGVEDLRFAALREDFRSLPGVPTTPGLEEVDWDLRRFYQSLRSPEGSRPALLLATYRAFIAHLHETLFPEHDQILFQVWKGKVTLTALILEHFLTILYFIFNIYLFKQQPLQLKIIFSRRRHRSEFSASIERWCRFTATATPPDVTQPASATSCWR
jgi:hypothetical protein